MKTLNKSTENIMKDVLIALMPAVAVGVYYFKTRAFLIILISVLTCVLSEYAWQKLTKRKVTIKDLSAAVTGILLALNLSSEVPFWIPIVGGIFAVIIVKQFFGGFGQNFMNPVLTARAFLVASWPSEVNKWVIDGVSASTPLQIIKKGSGTLPDMWNAFIGNTGGAIGETCALALIIGGIYLIWRRVISFRIPVSYLVTVYLLTWMIGRDGIMSTEPLYEILIGGLMLGAIYMATDPSTSPKSKIGQYIMGIGCGVFTSIFRIYGGTPEGVSYAILVMNLFVPLIDKFTVKTKVLEVK
ncbi:RnfABCDGE type electron transport complex subunit D [Haloimpatiens sp. FM7330]|uniref:RnfABCDGE type electron transport complex subunit D n=1 Tax=Haloimpatiens sp. FM7330 TaxID=3298610 RepID=UPI0036340C5A